MSDKLKQKIAEILESFLTSPEIGYAETTEWILEEVEKALNENGQDMRFLNLGELEYYSSF